MICKGQKLNNLKFGIIFIELDDFLREQTSKIWSQTDEIWTISVKEKDMDFYLTKAQEEINMGVVFEKTDFYMIMNELLENGFKIAMWYDTYCEDLPVCNSKKEVLDACYSGITDVLGMCEVYFKMF